MPLNHWTLWSIHLFSIILFLAPPQNNIAHNILFTAAKHWLPIRNSLVVIIECEEDLNSVSNNKNDNENSVVDFLWGATF